MKYEWDEKKNRINMRRHNIDFSDVKEMFDYPMLIGLDAREDYREDRWVGIGILKNIVAVVIFTEVDDNTIRIISARKATKHERKKYEKGVQY